MMRLVNVVLILLCFGSAEATWYFDDHVIFENTLNANPVHIKNRFQPTRKWLNKHFPELAIRSIQLQPKESLVGVTRFYTSASASPDCKPARLELANESMKDSRLFWLWPPSLYEIELPSSHIHYLPGVSDDSNSFLHFAGGRKIALDGSTGDSSEACSQYYVRWFELHSDESEEQKTVSTPDTESSLLTAGGFFSFFSRFNPRPRGIGVLFSELQVVLMSAEQFYLTQQWSETDTNLPVDFDDLVVLLVSEDGEEERFVMAPSDWLSFMVDVLGVDKAPLYKDLIPRESVIYSRSDNVLIHNFLEAYEKHRGYDSMIPAMVHLPTGKQNTSPEVKKSQPASQPEAQPVVNIEREQRRKTDKDKDDERRDDGKKWLCHECGQCFNGEQQLAAHLKEHSDSFVPDIESAAKLFPLARYFDQKTAQQLLNIFGDLNPAHWPAQAFVNQLMERTEDDLALRYANAAKKALQDLNPMPVPGMKFTIENMLEKLDVFLSHSWLADDDRERLKNFRGDLQKIQRQGYPYFESINKSLIFSAVQVVFYKNAHQHEPGLVAEIEKAGIHKLDKDASEQHINPINFERVFRVFGQGFFTDNYLKRVGMSRRINVAASNGENRSDMIDRILRKMFMVRNEKMFFISFADFGVKTFNLMTYLPITPIGLLDGISAFHDNGHMSCGKFPWHDLMHFDRCSQLIFEEVGDNYSKAYERVRLFYQQHRSAVTEDVFSVSELILFYFYHEQETVELRKIHSILDKLYPEHIRYLHEIPGYLKDWSDLPVSKKVLEDDNFFKALVFVQQFQEGKEPEVQDYSVFDKKVDSLLKALDNPGQNELVMDELKRLEEKKVNPELDKISPSTPHSYYAGFLTSINHLKEYGWRGLHFSSKLQVFFFLNHPYFEKFY